MNPNEKIQDQSGKTPASNPEFADSSHQRAESGDIMKRALAKQLIEKYYYQLTDGCGQEECGNRFCASCDSFTFKEKTRNALAVQAVELFKRKAKLCEVQPSKIAKIPDNAPSASTSGSGDTASNRCERVEPLSVVTSEERPSSDLSGFPGPSKGATSKISPTSASFRASPDKSPGGEVKILTEEIIGDLIAECEKENSWTKLIRLIGATFNNPDSLIQSFRIQPQTTERPREDQEKHLSDQAECSKSVEEMVVHDDPDDLSGDIECDKISVDLESLRRSYAALMAIPDTPFQGALINALTSLSRTVDIELRYHKMFDRNPDYINIFIICMEIPLLSSPEFIENAFPQLCKAIGQLSIQGQAKLSRVWSKFGAKRINEMVQSLHQLITVRIVQNEGRWGRNFCVNDDEGLTSATKVMKILYYASIYGSEKDSPETVAEEKSQNEMEETLQDMLQLQGAFSHEPKETRQPKGDLLSQELGVNHLDARKPLVEYEDFVNETLNDNLDLETDYKYKLENETKFSYLNHSFILTTASKQRGMNFDNRVRMFNERRSSIQQTVLFGIPPVPYLRLRVRRDHLIDDALVNLEMTAMDNPQDLKKQLIVEFEGEQGLDEGGVSKEFFQLVVEEIFNPDFGMFTYNEETRHFWFNPTSFENDGQFTLIGIVLGLAIYNNTIVDVHFPPCVYRKLMGKKGSYPDLEDMDPTLFNSLKQILEYDKDDMKDVFLQTFCIGYKDVFGANLTHDLKEKGEEIYVNQENKQEFVDMYSDFILNKAIEKQFNAFKRGFLMVTNESPLRILFRPEEVEELICGSKRLDFYELEDSTDYDGGFTKDSSTIKNFWLVVHAFSDDQKRQVLQFTTGTDRVPVGGLSKLKLIIARNGPDSDRLPTAHTCFNVLLLPDYSSKEKLTERLLKAITYSKGFGML